MSCLKDNLEVLSQLELWWSDESLLSMNGKWSVAYYFFAYLFVTYCFCFMFWFLAVRHVDLSSMARDWTVTSSIGKWSLNHCTAREVLLFLNRLWILRLCENTCLSFNDLSFLLTFSYNSTQVNGAQHKTNKWPSDKQQAKIYNVGSKKENTHTINKLLQNCRKGLSP